MKLLKARFENFRLLRDVEIEFSSDADRKLTVIRAANESGKTTLLNALQWGLYGDSAFGARASEFRLHPIDWPDSGGARVPITVTIEFELVKYNRMRESRSRYRLVRTTLEELRGNEWTRTPSTVRLYILTDSGASGIASPDALIHEELPIELREVFFTDGDRALSFIESDVAVSTKRDRVQRAIRALLGLSVVEEAIKHVKKAVADVNKEVKTLGADAELQKVATQLEEAATEGAKLEEQAEGAGQQFAAFDEKLSEIDKKIDEVLKRGDREKLSQDIQAAKKQLARLDERIAAAAKNHSRLFRSQALATDVLGPVLTQAMSFLDALHDKGKIPNTTIPVLEERLKLGVCICGESLTAGDAGGTRRRSHILEVVDNSRKADELQKIATDLYYGSKSLLSDASNPSISWLAQYTSVVEERDGLGTLRDDEGRKLKGFEAQLDALPDVDIKGLRETQRSYKEQRDRFHAERARAEAQLELIKKQVLGLSQRRDALLREQKKGTRILSEFEAAGDVQTVLTRAWQRITTEELGKVSSMMNSLFLEMIGADPEQGAVITKAEISQDFDILVYGPSGRTLNPDRDLNGASRRALTIAFILALTKVSEVEAPNVIDTPLGMMSGFVKRAVLRIAARESSQLILFLTHSEIAGCEDILDSIIGNEYTISNASHYPKMLRNDPKAPDRRVLICKCGHRSVCSICERNADELALAKEEEAQT